MLDKSLGKGLELDAETLYPFLQAIQNAFPAFGLGVAGGLGPDTLHLLKPLIKEFPNLSIDACAKLHKSGNALGPIDWEVAGRYLINALQLLH